MRCTAEPLDKRSPIQGFTAALRPPAYREAKLSPPGLKLRIRADDHRYPDARRPHTHGGIGRRGFESRERYLRFPRQLSAEFLVSVA
jgi:hypothetical protein